MPREIRSQIFEYVIGPAVSFHAAEGYIRGKFSLDGTWKDRMANGSGPWPKGVDFLHREEAPGSVCDTQITLSSRGPNSFEETLVAFKKLLVINKQTRQDVLASVLSSSVAEFYTMDSLVCTYSRLMDLPYIDMYGEAQKFKGFKKILLHFTLRELYRLIGFECTPGTGFNIPYQPPRGPISSIADLPSLQDLELHISISMGRRLMQEGSHETSRHDSPWIDEKTLGIRLFQCAETLLEYFLILGYDKLRLARSITFGGIPRFEREKLSVISGKSLSLDMSEKVEKIRSLPAQTLYIVRTLIYGAYIRVLRLRDPLGSGEVLPTIQTDRSSLVWGKGIQGNNNPNSEENS